MKLAALCGQARGMLEAVETGKLSGARAVWLIKAAHPPLTVCTLSSPVAAKGQPRWTVTSCHVGQLASSDEGRC